MTRSNIKKDGYIYYKGSDDIIKNFIFTIEENPNEVFYNMKLIEEEVKYEISNVKIKGIAPDINDLKVKMLLSYELAEEKDLNTFQFVDTEDKRKSLYI